MMGQGSIAVLRRNKNMSTRLKARHRSPRHKTRTLSRYASKEIIKPFPSA